jgi:hypothetical protein
MESNPGFHYDKGNPMYGCCGIYTDVCECRASKNAMVNTPPLSYFVIRTIVKKLKHPAAPYIPPSPFTCLRFFLIPFRIVS